MIEDEASGRCILLSMIPCSKCLPVNTNWLKIRYHKFKDIAFGLMWLQLTRR
jgi:hypothetical protein